MNILYPFNKMYMVVQKKEVNKQFYFENYTSTLDKAHIPNMKRSFILFNLLYIHVKCNKLEVT
jgi:hypothetical protein